MSWFRIDNRLVHGQVIEGWLPYVAATDLIIANDAFALDILRQQIASLAVPENVALHFVSIDDLVGTIASCKGAFLVLFEDCHDARRAYESGVLFDRLNIGNLHYAEGKIQVLPHIALSDHDKEDLSYLQKRNILLDFRRVPAESVRVPDELF